MTTQNGTLPTAVGKTERLLPTMDMVNPPDGTVLGSFSASGTPATIALLEQLASIGTLDPASTALLARLQQDIRAIGDMMTTDESVAVAQFQETQRRTHAFDESRQFVEAAAISALNEMHIYQREAPRLAPLDAHTVLNHDLVAAWSEQAQRLATTFEDLSMRLNAHMQMLSS